MDIVRPLDLQQLVAMYAERLTESEWAMGIS